MGSGSFTTSKAPLTAVHVKVTKYIQRIENFVISWRDISVCGKGVQSLRSQFLRTCFAQFSIILHEHVARQDNAATAYREPLCNREQSVGFCAA